MIEIGPGMARKAHCTQCDGPLTVDDGERCAKCRSQLSVRAEEIGKLRKKQRDLITAMELAAGEIDVIIKRLDRKVRLNGYRRNP